MTIVYEFDTFVNADAACRNYYVQPNECDSLMDGNKQIANIGQPGIGQIGETVFTWNVKDCWFSATNTDVINNHAAFVGECLSPTDVSQQWDTADVQVILAGFLIAYATGYVNGAFIKWLKTLFELSSRG